MKPIIKHDWALSDEAKLILKSLIDAGFDTDLAITIMENTLSDELLYNMRDKDE